jgi:hypothetical protein
VITSLAMLVGSYRAGVVLAMTMAVAGLAACGENESETNYSASTFSECLSAKDVAPKDIVTGQSEGDRYFDELNRLAAQAARENGAIEAFGNEALPGASTTYFLFFEAHGAAQAAEGELGRIAREEGSSDKLAVRGNLLSVASTVTEAQTRIIDECLGRSEL